MTNEKMLSLINKAMENLRDSEDGYGKTPVDFMRKNGIKSTDNMAFFLDSVGAYLEELRCGIIEDIQTAEAKKNGKSSMLSAIKKLCKECYNTNINTKTQLAYANYDEETGKYFTVSGYWMLVSDKLDGMIEMPENVKKNIATPFNYKRYLPDIYTYHAIPLPDMGKLAAHLKNAKAKKTKNDKLWNKVTLKDEFSNDVISLHGEWLLEFMKITGATEIYAKDSMHTLYMEGNDYQAIIMPIKNYSENKATGEKIKDEVTDFDNI